MSMELILSLLLFNSRLCLMFLWILFWDLQSEIDFECIIVAVTSECECDWLYNICIAALSTMEEFGGRETRKSNFKSIRADFFCTFWFCVRLLLIFCCRWQKLIYNNFEICYFCLRACVYLHRFIFFILLLCFFCSLVFVLLVLCCSVLFVDDGGCCCFYLLGEVFFLFISVARDKSFSMNFAWHDANVERNINKHNIT